MPHAPESMLLDWHPCKLSMADVWVVLLGTRILLTNVGSSLNSASSCRVNSLSGYWSFDARVMGKKSRLFTDLTCATVRVAQPVRTYFIWREKWVRGIHNWMKNSLASALVACASRWGRRRGLYQESCPSTRIHGHAIEVPCREWPCSNRWCIPQRPHHHRRGSRTDKWKSVN